MKRVRLPNDRLGLTRRVAIGKVDFYVMVAFYENKQPGEVFIHVGKEGSILSGMLDIVAVLISLMLQTGIPANVITAKLINSKFEPSDQTFSSIADAIGKTLVALTLEWGGEVDKDHLKEFPNE